MRRVEFFLILVIAVCLNIAIILSLWSVFAEFVPKVSADIRAIVTTALGTIFATLSADILFNQWKKPYLRITEFHKLISTNNRGEFWRAKVENEGRSGAENCCGDLVMIGVFPKHTLKIEGRVCWARIGNPEQLTVNSGDIQYLDIMTGYYDANGHIQIIQFPTEDGHKPPRPILQKRNTDWMIAGNTIKSNDILNGKWENRIKITSTNGAVIEKKFFWEIDNNQLKLKF